MSNYTSTIGPRPRPAGRPPPPRPSDSRGANPNTLSWVTYNNPQDHPGSGTGQPTPGPSSRPLPNPTPASNSLPNPFPRPLRVVNTTEPQNLDANEGGETVVLDPNAFSPQYPNLAGPSSRPPPQKKPTLMGGLMKGFTNIPKKMFSRSGSSNGDSEHNYPTRKPTAGGHGPTPPLPSLNNGNMPSNSKPVPQSRYLPKPPSQPPPFVQPSQPLQPMQSIQNTLSELSGNTLFRYPQGPLSEIPEVESNAPSPPPQVVRLSATEHSRPRHNSIRRVPPPTVTDPVEGPQRHREENLRPNIPIPRITIMDFNDDTRNTQYPQSAVEQDEPESPEDTMPGGLMNQPTNGQTLSYASSEQDTRQGAPVFPMLAPPTIRSPSPPHSDTPSSPDIRSPTPNRPRAEPNPNARPPAGILFKPQGVSNTRSNTPPPSLVPGSSRLSIVTPFPHHQALSDDYDEHEHRQTPHPAILFSGNPLPPMSGPHEAEGLLSPISVHPQPAEDYRGMATMSPEPLESHLGTTTTGTSYYRSDRSYAKHTKLNPIERFFKRLYNMPWISRDRVTVDYLPGEQEKGGKLRPKKTKPLSSWYHAVLGRTKRFSNSNSLDLLTTGSGSAQGRGRDRMVRDERDDRGRTRTKEAGRHHRHDSSTRDKEKHHKHHHRHHHSSSSRHRHQHHRDHSEHSHHHRHHSGSRHSKRRRTASISDEEVERMKNMPPMPVFPYPYPPYSIPALPGFPIPVIATTEDGEMGPHTSTPKPGGQAEGSGTHNDSRPRTRSQPAARAAFGVYAPPGYQPYPHLVGPGAPPMYMFSPQQLGIPVKQQQGGGVNSGAEHPHPKIEPVTNSPSAPVAQTLANVAAKLAADDRVKEGDSGSGVPGSFQA